MVDYFSAGSDVLNLPNTLINIVSAVQKISTQRRSGKEKCAELLVDAFTLKDMIENPNVTDDDLQGKRIEKLIVRIKDCLVRFSKADWLDDTVEAMFKNDYSQLQNEYRELQDRYLLGAVNQGVSLWHKVLEAVKNPAPAHSSTHITTDISALNWQESVGRGNMTGYGDVECRKLDNGLSSQRALNLYQDLQRGAHIQKLHGIVVMDEQDYVIMQDCSTLPTLKSWRSDPSRVLTLRDRVLLAYDVAQSIAWLHGGGLLVKYLTESSIRLRSDHKSRQHPVLTQLHYTRCLYEKTNSVRIDYRYEAQEILADLLQKQGSVPHSHETDIWSLGVIVWQILTDGTPYLIEEPIYFYNHEQDATTLRRHLENHPFPGSYPVGFPSLLIDIIQSCWSPIDQGRPSAMAVAGSLLRAHTLLNKTVMSTVKDYVGDSVAIESSQDLGMARLTAWQLVHKARKRAKVRDEQVGQLSNHHASVLLRHSENPEQPECAFLVGALIWWDLLNVWLVDDSTMPRSHLGFDGMLTPETFQVVG
ncbi:isoform 4 of fibroblast growth factor receptor 1-A [Fusarium pseudocircinatum]|uniref:Isoform 4 of fibroblast growth factor receptor 1-A n=1 Tax=Fusarium pseudocircinatum TaxID=56676 RepID=A0A8H5PL14_9HYPO|nr:isoform 4 of fibroblast growth factor receptor 1-A [Fusarium pseudocircinatum]